MQGAKDNKLNFDNALIINLSDKPTSKSCYHISVSLFESSGLHQMLTKIYSFVQEISWVGRSLEYISLFNQTWFLIVRSNHEEMSI